ncbi:MAG: DHHW family protein, partial [Lachnospira sp.]|nr:DHHW family protein [Lachnospira sp.]
MINNENDFIDYNIVTDVSGWNTTSKYSAFIGGDNAYTEINNPAIMDGSSVLVIKESFGNAFVPFLVENFQNVYVIDYRYYDGTVSELVDKYNIENVVFVNNISITSTQGRVQELKNICK